MIKKDSPTTAGLTTIAGIFQAYYEQCHPGKQPNPRLLRELQDPKVIELTKGLLLSLPGKDSREQARLALIDHLAPRFQDGQNTNTDDDTGFQLFKDIDSFVKDEWDTLINRIDLSPGSLRQRS